MIKCNFCFETLDICKCDRDKSPMPTYETKIVEPDEYKTLKSKTVVELKKIAKANKIKGYSKMREEELIKAIMGQS